MGAKFRHLITDGLEGRSQSHFQLKSTIVLQLCQCASFLPCVQRFESGDDIEQFLVDATLAQTMKCPVEILQQFVDVFVGALHRHQAARILTRKGFGARPEERDEKIFADERPQGHGAATHDFGQVSRRPWKFGQFASPVFVQR